MKMTLKLNGDEIGDAVREYLVTRSYISAEKSTVSFSVDKEGLLLGCEVEIEVTVECNNFRS